jgi:hypothetical protein
VIDALLRSGLVALSAEPAAAGRGPLARLRAAALRGVVAALLRRRRLGDVLDLLGAEGTQRHGAEASRIADALRRTGASCLVRALGGYAALRRRGEEVTFVLGVGRAQGELVAHAWLEREGEPVGEPEDPRAHFTVALEHPRPRAAPGVIGERVMSALTPSADVILTELRDGTGVLLHLGTKMYFALNATGVVAWKALASGEAADIEQVTRIIVARFAGAEPGAVRRDVEALVEELTREGLLGPPKDSPR